MFIEAEYYKNKFETLDSVMQSIPPLRGGKSDAGAIVSFTQDIETYRKFRKKYLFADTKEQLKELIEKWNDFIARRENENYIPHRESQHSSFYYTLF